MADIRQSAHWMEEGKTVTRQAYGERAIPVTFYQPARDGISPILYSNGKPAAFFTEDLLADDWRIA